MRKIIASAALAATLAACGGPTGLHDPAKLASAITAQVPAVPNDPDVVTTCVELDGGTFTCNYAWSDGSVYLLHVTVSVDGQMAELTGDGFDTQQVTA